MRLGKNMGTTVSFLILALLLTSPASALKNPSAVYCEALGYNYSVDVSDYGEAGYCLLPSGQKVDAWAFLLGEAGQDFGYCAQQGYQQKLLEGCMACIQFATCSCAACVLPDGREVEVTRLMNLSFNESECRDGHCGFPENFAICPSDCPSGGWDGYCDGLAEGRCDPDCAEGEDPDCDGVPEGFE